MHRRLQRYCVNVPFVVTSPRFKKACVRYTRLLPMRQLADADRVCFKLKALTELDLIILSLKAH